MEHKLEGYKRIREDLIKQIELCHQYKKQIKSSLQKLKKQYESDLIDKNTYEYNINQYLEERHPQDWYSMYDAHISKCHHKVNYYNEKINEIAEVSVNKRNTLSKVFMLVGILSLIFSIVFLVQPTITGLIPYSLESQITFEDGYTKEGSQWVEISGSRVYERCLKVSSEIDFNSANIIAKVTSATDNKGLIFSLYDNDELNDEPSGLISSCRISEYNDIWKSCTLNNLQQNKGEYWICAANSNGNSETTYFTIAYQNGDPRKTALWTGENWQKLDRASYTIKVEFIKRDE